jgi:4-amino-4-deoxy-L-arabinose transferase-like glycosyltransferase
MDGPRKPHQNGWRTGNDPTLRALRAIAVSALIALLVWWVIFDAEENPLVGALLVGAILAALFGDIGIALPFLRAERRQDDERD